MLHQSLGIRQPSVRILRTHFSALLTSSDVGVFTDSSRLGSKGWVVGEQGEMLFWVPPLHRASICRPNTVCVIGANVTRPDLSHFVHGTKWNWNTKPSLSELVVF